MLELKLKSDSPLLCGQKTAILEWVGQSPIKELHPDLLDKLVGELPKGNRSVILCLFKGEHNIPFMHVGNWGTAKLMRLHSQIGENFQISIIGQVKPNEASQEIIPHVLEMSK